MAMFFEVFHTFFREKNVNASHFIVLGAAANLDFYVCQQSVTYPVELGWRFIFVGSKISPKGVQILEDMGVAYYQLLTQKKN